MQKNPLFVSVKRLIWLYFLLWIFEGVLRKWILPSIAGPLVFLRDGVLIVLYVQAIRARMFRPSGWMVFWAGLGFVSLLAGAIALPNALAVVLYGYRTNFMHVPLIFLIPQAFDANDVRKIGYWTLAISFPMALLMYLQFHAGPSDILNAGAGEGTEQLNGALGHVRAAGTFSYIMGPAYFFPLVAAFLIQGQLVKGTYPRWLLATAFVGVFIASICSLSRALVADVLLVVAFGFIAGLLVNVKLALRWLTIAAVGLVIVGSFARLSVFGDAFDAFGERLTEADASESGTGGFLGRVLLQFNTPFTGTESASAMMIGQGLGLGTNFAAIILTGQRGFLLAETEWQRIYLESGVVLGGALILYRISLVAWLCMEGLKRARSGNTLPLLLISTCGLAVTNGQWGLPTTLGFSVFVSGLCMASLRAPYVVTVAAEKERIWRRMAGRRQVATSLRMVNEAR